MLLPGPELLGLCREAEKEVILVAPFIKRDAMQMTLDVIPHTVSSIRCVTRWRPEEILAGVSDLEIFDLISERTGASLLVQPLLHAKYYRIDGRCLVGSANLTKRGMGWAMPTNLELSVGLDATIDPLPEFEKFLLSTAIPATEELRNDIATAVEAMEREGTVFVAEEAAIDDGISSIPPEYWLPLCLRPELLYRIITETHTEQIVGWTLEAGRRDIGALRIPPNLSEQHFRNYVAALLRQSPLIHKLDQIAHTSLSSTEGREFITKHVPEEYRAYGADQHWKTMRSWLLYFLPDEYRQPSGSSKLQRGTEIGQVSH